MDSEYMTTAEVAELVHAPVETVRYWCHIGKAPKSIKLGRRRLFRRSDVVTWIEDQFGKNQ
jgi:excisionase family DNA binding protein